MAAQRIRRFVAGVCLVFLPSIAAAQSATTGAIAGVVKDSSGAVLPGVTVEAASPALIEKLRSVVTDDQGNYKIIELRPGTYSVTFTLPGFSTLKREGVELTVGFTAAVNAELKVGGIEETVTVTSEASIVDVQNVRTAKVLTVEVLDTLPTFKSTGGFLAVTLGSASPGNQDVGGNRGEGIPTMSIHGSALGDTRWKLDGMSWTTNLGTGSTRTHRWNTVGVGEVVVEGGGTPDNETGGAQLNYIPRDGGNRFSVYSVNTYTNKSLQGNNLNDELRARGVSSQPGANRIWDYGVGVGGPILTDRLWFYQSNRWWGGSDLLPNAYYNKTLGSILATPDTSRPVTGDNWANDWGGRLTWQAAAKHKITFSDNVQRNCNCTTGVTAVVYPEANGASDNYWNQVAQGTWNYPATNKLLFAAGFAFGHFPQADHLVFGTTPQTIGVQDLGTGARYNAKSTMGGIRDFGEGRSRNNVNEQMSVSYVTGSHATKVGVQLGQGIDNENTYIPNDITYQLRNQVPASIIEWASPEVHRLRLQNVAIYAQDQWTLKKLTVNYGLRFDTLKGKALGEHLAPSGSIGVLQCTGGTTESDCQSVQVPTGRFLVPRDFPEVNNVPNFKDLSPRISAAYDLFGNGKTAIKGSIHRYVSGLGFDLPLSVAPELAIVNSTTRTWSDSQFGAGDPRTGNFVPDCDLQNPSSNGECGPIGNTAFGQSVINTVRDPSVTTGFGNRAYNWQATAGVQHELQPGVAVTATYFRTWYGNFQVTDNTLVTPANYDPYCVTLPSDARLPGGGGTQLCGLYDLQRASFGQVSNRITQASTFGTQTDVYNGIDLAFNARFGHGGFLSGGMSVGREVVNCATVDSPQLSQAAFGGLSGVTATFATPINASNRATAGPGWCDVTPPWSAGTQVKLNGSYPLPYGLEAAAVFQNLPGIPDVGVWALPNSVAAPALGRNLAACTAPTGACTASIPVDVLPGWSTFEDRLTQVDLRFSKNIKVGQVKFKGLFDIYNIFNASTVLAVNTTYAPPPSTTWLQPLSILGPRLFKFGFEVNF